MIPCQRDLFDLPDDVAYLNCAYMSPLLKHAAALGAQGIARKTRPWTISPDDFFADSERARAVRRASGGERRRHRPDAGGELRRSGCGCEPAVWRGPRSCIAPRAVP
jgi:hypothetical protein